MKHSKRKKIMQIYPISNFSNNYIFNKRNERNSYSTNFRHHPDFVELKKSYEITASNYFRRGGYYGSASKNFVDIINTLKLFFDENKNNKVTMLIGGLADSQECFSDLAVIKSLIGKKRIDSVLDLYTIDLQSRPNRKTLFLQSFYDDNWTPKYVPESFVREETSKYGFMRLHRYKVKSNIFKYLLSVYNNPEKSKWETRIQEEITNYPNKKFDIISMNNTLGYILDYGQRMKTTKEIYNKLNLNGVFITDPHITEYQEIFSPDVCEEIYPGIYKKTDSADANISEEPMIIHSKDGTDFVVNMK